MSNYFIRLINWVEEHGNIKPASQDLAQLGIYRCKEISDARWRGMLKIIQRWTDFIES